MALFSDDSMVPFLIIEESAMCHLRAVCSSCKIDLPLAPAVVLITTVRVMLSRHFLNSHIGKIAPVGSSTSHLSGIG